MRAFIHAFRGRPWNKECCDAKDGFHKLGIETVMFTTNEEFDLRNPEDVVVGGTVIVLHALHQRGIVPDEIDQKAATMEPVKLSVVAEPSAIDKPSILANLHKEMPKMQKSAVSKGKEECL